MQLTSHDVPQILFRLKFHFAEPNLWGRVLLSSVLFSRLLTEVLENLKISVQIKLEIQTIFTAVLCLLHLGILGDPWWLEGINLSAPADPLSPDDTVLDFTLFFTLSGGGSAEHDLRFL